MSREDDGFSLEGVRGGEDLGEQNGRLLAQRRAIRLGRRRCCRGGTGQSGAGQSGARGGRLLLLRRARRAGLASDGSKTGERQEHASERCPAAPRRARRAREGKRRSIHRAPSIAQTMSESRRRRHRENPVPRALLPSARTRLGPFRSRLRATAACALRSLRRSCRSSSPRAPPWESHPTWRRVSLRRRAGRTRAPPKPTSSDPWRRRRRVGSPG